MLSAFFNWRMPLIFFWLNTFFSWKAFSLCMADLISGSLFSVAYLCRVVLWNSTHTAFGRFKELLAIYRIYLDILNLLLITPWIQLQNYKLLTRGSIMESFFYSFIVYCFQSTDWFLNVFYQWVFDWFFAVIKGTLIQIRKSPYMFAFI